MLSLKKEELKSYQDAKVCYICGKRFQKSLLMIKVIEKLETIAILQVNIEKQHIVHVLIRFNVPNKIPVVFHNGSIYEYHFIIIELADEFEGQFEWFEENTENYQTFSIPIEKEVKNIDKDGKGRVVTIPYKIRFIDSASFMVSALSNLVNDLAEGIHKIKCKDCDYFLEYEIVKDNFIKHKCLSCNKDYSNKLDEKLKKRFKNTFKFFDNDINNFTFLLRKSGMDDCGKSLRKQNYLKKKNFVTT